MVQEDDVLPRATKPPILSALRAKNDTTNLLAINLASQQKTIKLYFSSQVRKQFKLLTVPFKPLRCCLRSDKLVNCHVWKFYKDLFLNCRVSSWPDLSIKSYFWMVSSLILLRSLHVYILKQLFFSISVNSGFRNIYLATSRLGKYVATTSISRDYYWIYRNVIPLVSSKFFLTPRYFGLSLLQTGNRGREGVRNEVSRWGSFFFVYETKPLKLIHTL